MKKLFIILLTCIMFYSYCYEENIGNNPTMIGYEDYRVSFKIIGDKTYEYTGVVNPNLPGSFHNYFDATTEVIPRPDSKNLGFSLSATFININDSNSPMLRIYIPHNIQAGDTITPEDMEDTEINTKHYYFGIECFVQSETCHVLTGEQPFQIYISDLDIDEDQRVKGTFNGCLKNQNTDEIIEIENGSFNAPASDLLCERLMGMNN